MRKRRRKYEEYAFEDLAKIVNRYLKAEGYTLNFMGYQDTLKQYFSMQDNNPESIRSLMIECNLWSNYFSELEKFLLLKKEEYMLEADRYLAEINKQKPSLDTEIRIQNAKKRAKHFDLFAKHCHAKMNFFKYASNQCHVLYAQCLKRLNQTTA